MGKAVRVTMVKTEEVSHSSASSFAENLSVDLIDVDTSRFVESNSSISSHQEHDDTLLKLKDDQSTASTDLHKSQEPDDRFLDHATEPQVSHSSHESLELSTSPMESPKVQFMERHDEYDPHRIPASMFAQIDSLTPIDWSAGSTESLFSIRIGNISVRRDHPLMMNGESQKYLTKSGEIVILKKSGELLMFSPSPSARVQVDDDDEKVDEVTHIKNKEVPAIEAKKGVGRTTPEVDQDEVIRPVDPLPVVQTSNVSLHSVGKEGVTCLFAFPIKKCCKIPFLCSRKKLCKCKISILCCKTKTATHRKKCAWPSCCRTSSSWGSCFRAFKWPSCQYKWPNCKRPAFFCCNCSLGFCYCGNCNRKRKTTMLANGAKRNAIANTSHTEKPPSGPHLQAQNPPTTSFRSSSCFSCPSSSCSCFSCCSSHSCITYRSCSSCVTCPCCFSCRSCNSCFCSCTRCC